MKTFAVAFCSDSAGEVLLEFVQATDAVNACNKHSELKGEFDSLIDGGTSLALLEEHAFDYFDCFITAKEVPSCTKVPLPSTTSIETSSSEGNAGSSPAAKAGPATPLTSPGSVPPAGSSGAAPSAPSPSPTNPASSKLLPGSSGTSAAQLAATERFSGTLSLTKLTQDYSGENFSSYLKETDD